MEPIISQPRTSKTSAKRWLLTVSAALGSGVMLGLAGPPLQAWPLLFAALVPALAVLLDRRTTLPAAVVATTCIGFGQNLTAAAVLQFPLAFALFLVTSMGLFWPLVGLIVQPLARRLGIGGAALCTAAAFTVVEVLAFTVVPVFGTAQSFGRCLIACPSGVAIASLGGVGAVVFVLVLPQALVALVLVRRNRGGLLAGVALVLGTWVVWGGSAGMALFAAEEPMARVRVAAVGWTYEQLGSPWSSGLPATTRLETVLSPLLDEAVDAGAEVVVAPEAAFRVTPGQREDFLAHASSMAASREVTLVVGFFDEAQDVNEAAIFIPDGTLAAVYRKTHLILGMEDYVAGDGTLVVVGEPLPDGYEMGALICQDDNFRDLGRAYGREGVSVLAVPTNDWKQVQEFHLQNTRLRAVDSGFAIVRGATNGISAIVDQNGRLLAQRDHHAQGPGVVVADLPLYPGGTIYSRTGEWATGACVLALVVGAVVPTRKRIPRRTD